MICRSLCESSVCVKCCLIHRSLACVMCDLRSLAFYCETLVAVPVAQFHTALELCSNTYIGLARTVYIRIYTPYIW